MGFRDQFGYPHARQYPRQSVAWQLEDVAQVAEKYKETIPISLPNSLPALAAMTALFPGIPTPHN
jgi:hypothetical protein